MINCKVFDNLVENNKRFEKSDDSPLVDKGR